MACQADARRFDATGHARIVRHFDILPHGLPIAALTRQLDGRDALGQGWLRADPAHVRPDMASARLVACGDDLHLGADEADALLKPLKPLFGDAGFPISVPSGAPSRWYLALPSDARVPDFSEPDAVFGDDLLAHLPDGALGQRWRALLNEAQVILHNHPVNAMRVRAGKLPVNSLWFWGAGRLPDSVASPLTDVASDDPLILALAQHAGIACQRVHASASAAMRPDSASVRAEEARDRSLLTALGVQQGQRVLLDLRSARTVSEADDLGLRAAVQAIAAGRFSACDLECADGLWLHWRKAHRWRFWRSRLPA